MIDSLHVKYRPTSFKKVVGHDALVKSLKDVLKSGTSRAFLFSGPAGCGKTTLARLSSALVGCQSKDMLELDGATYTGIDYMRSIVETLQYKPFGESQVKSIVIDECHALSRQAWQSLLKSVEEPPPYTYWFFCTTELGKVPQTIRNRCTSYQLRLLPDDTIRLLVRRVTKKEEISFSDSILDLIVREAKGSPRQALVNVALCRGVTSKQEVVEVLKTALESDVVIDLCRFLLKGGSWGRAMKIIKKLEDHNPESVRIVVVNYMASVLKSSTSDDTACRVLSILDAFADSYVQSDRDAPLLLSVGRVLFEQE